MSKFVNIVKHTSCWNISCVSCFIGVSKNVVLSMLNLSRRSYLSSWQCPGSPLQEALRQRHLEEMYRRRIAERQEGDLRNEDERNENKRWEEKRGSNKGGWMLGGRKVIGQIRMNGEWHKSDLTNRIKGERQRCNQMITSESQAKRWR